MSLSVRIPAPAKVNLCLYLGARRPDGLHRLASLFEPVGLWDELEIESGGGEDDEVRFRFEGPFATEDRTLGGERGSDTVSRALGFARDAGLQGPALSVTVRKRIPSGAGLGGASADAAALLRYLRDSAAHLMPGGRELDLRAIAMRVGADVPSQIDPAPSLVGGAGEEVRRLPGYPEHHVLLVPGRGGLATGEVFAEADRLGLGRSDAELEEVSERLARLRDPLDRPDLMVNDLEAAAFSLRPDLRETRDRLEGLGAVLARMTGSGSTIFGVFRSRVEAERAGEELGAGALAVQGGAPAIDRGGDLGLRLP